mgnify:CR=1 FL=1
MYCRRCGQLNDDGATRCVKCAEALYRPQSAPTRVSSHLAFAVVVTVLCCVPAGIPAIVYASRVTPLAIAGEVEAAQNASAKAGMWCWIALVAGLAGGLLYLGFMILAQFAERR